MIKIRESLSIKKRRQVVKLGIEKQQEQKKKDFKEEEKKYLISKVLYNSYYTFSSNSIHACRSIPKSIKVHSIPSRLYSSCSRTNMWWLKNCCNFSFVKLIPNQKVVFRLE